MERRLQNKIRCFEDMLLRSKNSYEVENLQKELFKLRRELQNIQYQKAVAAR